MPVAKLPKNRHFPLNVGEPARGFHAVRVKTTLARQVAAGLRLPVEPEVSPAERHPLLPTSLEMTPPGPGGRMPALYGKDPRRYVVRGSPQVARIGLWACGSLAEI
jgi:hypothetical protein